MALSSSLTTLFVLIMGVAIVGGLAGLLYAVHLHLSELMVATGTDAGCRRNCHSSFRRPLAATLTWAADKSRF